MWYIVRLDSSRVATLVKLSSDPTRVKSNYIPVQKCIYYDFTANRKLPLIVSVSQILDLPSFYFQKHYTCSIVVQAHATTGRSMCKTSKQKIQFKVGWGEHINHITNKFASGAHTRQAVKRYLSLDNMQSLYHRLVPSHLIYY